MYKIECRKKHEDRQISLVAGFNSVKRVEFNNTMRRYNNLLLDRILSNHTIDAQDRTEIEKSLNCHLHDTYYLAIVKVITEKPRYPRTQHENLPTFWRHPSRQCGFSGVLCFERSDFLVFFVPEEEQFSSGA